VVDFCSGRYFAGVSHQERHSDGGVVEKAAFGEQTVVPEHIAMVADEHNEGVLSQSLLVEVVEDLSHFLVKKCYRSIITFSEVMVRTLECLAVIFYRA